MLLVSAAVHMKKLFLFFFVLTLFTNQLVIGQRISGSPSFTIDDNLEERIFAINQLEFFEDKTNKLTFDNIITPKFQSNFKINPNFSKSNFNTDYTYWVKVSIQQNKASEKNWLMEFYDQSIDQITVFAPDEEGNYTEQEMGDSKDFGKRYFAHKNFEIPISNADNGLDNYYFKIRSAHKADVRIAVRSMNRFVYYALNEYFLYGIFYGMILVLSLYNFLVFLAVRERKYLYYIIYLISVGIYAMSVDGIAYQYLWPSYPEWNQIANGIFSFSIILWAILFSTRFLNARIKAPFLNTILKSILGIKILFFILGLIGYRYFFEIQLYDVIPFFLIFYMSIYIWIKGHKIARFFVAGYGALFIGATLKVLVNEAILPHTTLGYYSLHIAFLIEMILLSFALGDRIRIMKEMRDKAMQRILRQMQDKNLLKDRINRELETMVQERTRELQLKTKEIERSNELILQKDEEIKRINSFLDKDNWSLKSKVKQSFKARLTGQALTFLEFSQIFNDASACLRYLEDLKWGQGFVCGACGNDKGSAGPRIFTKRCTKCGYIESVTANTIFHGVRFPLEKAFYITYLEVNQIQKYTLDHWVEMLDLKKNTVWSFRKKVRNAMETLGLAKPSWEEVILANTLIKIR